MDGTVTEKCYFSIKKEKWLGEDKVKNLLLVARSISF